MWCVLVKKKKKKKKKILRISLNMGLPLCELELKRQFIEWKYTDPGKEKFPGAAVSREGEAIF